MAKIYFSYLDKYITLNFAKKSVSALSNKLRTKNGKYLYKHHICEALCLKLFVLDSKLIRDGIFDLLRNPKLKFFMFLFISYTEISSRS